MLSETDMPFDKHHTEFKIFGKYIFDVNWTLKQTISKLKEYGLIYDGAVSWGDSVTYRLWIRSDKEYNDTKEDKWEIDFVSINPNSEIVDIDYDYPNGADILRSVRKFHRGWFRNDYRKTIGE